MLFLKKQMFKKRIPPFLHIAFMTLLSASAKADVLGLSNPAEVAESRSAYAHMAAFAGSDFAPIQQIRRDLAQDYSPRSGRNIALANSRAVAGVEWQGFRLGVIQRQEWFAEAQKDTLDLYRNEHLSLNHEAGKNYAIDYHLRGFSATGVQLGKAFRHPLGEQWMLSWGGNISLLNGQKMRSESWSGNAYATGPQSLTLTVDGTRRYSGLNTIAHTFAPAFRFGNPSGTGYSVDLGMALDAPNGMRFAWTIGDAISQMRWTEIPEMSFQGTNVYNGTFPGGHKWRVNVRESLPVKQRLQWMMPIASADAQLILSDEVLRGTHFPSIGLQKDWGANWATKFDYDLRFHSLGLNARYGKLQMGLRSDKLNWRKARAFGASAAVLLDF